MRAVEGLVERVSRHALKVVERARSEVLDSAIDKDPYRARRCYYAPVRVTTAFHRLLGPQDITARGVSFSHSGAILTLAPIANSMRRTTRRGPAHRRSSRPSARNRTRPTRPRRAARPAPGAATPPSETGDHRHRPSGPQPAWCRSRPRSPRADARPAGPDGGRLRRP